MHRIYHNNYHISFTNVWTLNSIRNLDHELRNTNHFNIPFPRTNHFKKSPIYSLAKFWNELPNEDKAQENPFTFQTQIKNRLFSLIEAEILE